MSNLEDILAALHEGLAKELLKKVQAGEATAAELSVARQLLKDNHISGVAEKDDPLAKLSESMSDLPTFEDEDNVVNFGNRDG